MAPKVIQEKWLREAVARRVNPDGAYGLQCVDVADDYAETIFGVPWEVCVGGVNGASDLPDRVPDEYWIRYDNDPNDPTQVPEPYDVVVWEGLGPGSANPYGHVAIAASGIDANGANFLQQDGFAPPLKLINGLWHSDRPAEIVRLGWWNPGTGLIKSWLRPRPEKVIDPVAAPPAEQPPMPAVGGYDLITWFNAEPKNFTPAALVPERFRCGVRRIESITIHWWGLPEEHTYGGVFEHVIHYLCTNTNLTSAHEVITPGKVAVIVNHMDAAHAAGSALGNTTSLHLELDPSASPEAYATAARRIRDLRHYYGDVPLRPHNSWFATRCPGNWDLAKLDRLARETITEEEIMAISAADRRLIATEVLAYRVPRDGGGENNLDWTLRSIFAAIDGVTNKVVAAIKAEGAATRAAITEANK